MRIVQIAPEADPVLGGISASARAVAEELRRRHGIESAFLSAADLRAEVARGSAAPAPCMVLHYANYGYARRGCPWWLVRALAGWRRRGGSRAAGHGLPRALCFGASLDQLLLAGPCTTPPGAPDRALEHPPSHQPRALFFDPRHLDRQDRRPDPAGALDGRRAAGPGSVGGAGSTAGRLRDRGDAAPSLGKPPAGVGGGVSLPRGRRGPGDRPARLPGTREPGRATRAARPASSPGRR